MSNERVASLNIKTKRDIYKLVEKIFKNEKKFFDFKKTKIGELIILIDDGTKHRVGVYFDTVTDGEAYIQDNYENDEYFEFNLYINPNFIKTKKGLYNTIYHEVMHLSDPTVTTKPDDQYVNYHNYNYYALESEFRAWTSEILESLRNEVINELAYVENKKELHYLKNTLKNIVAHIADGYDLYPESSKLIRKMSGREETIIDFTEVLKKVDILYPNLSHLKEPIGEEEEIPTYLLILRNFQGANPKRWKDFIKMLKYTYDELIDLIDNSEIR